MTVNNWPPEFLEMLAAQALYDACVLIESHPPEQFKGLSIDQIREYLISQALAPCVQKWNEENAPYETKDGTQVVIRS